MSLSRVVGACVLASLVASVWGEGVDAAWNNRSTTTVTPANLTDTPALLSIPLIRVDGHAGGSTSLQRRYFKTNVLGVYGAAYLAEITVGTSSDPQKVNVLLDTGSFELWVNPDCANSNVPTFCQAFGQYDPARSPTSKSLAQSFAIQYGSGSVSGTYYTDDIFISGARITSQQFGVANTSDLVWFGIMGLARGRGNGFLNYNTVLDSVVSQRYANSRLFSLDLGSQKQPEAVISGEIVFGGVDTNKYAGNLVKVETKPSDPHYTVLLTGLAHRRPTAQTANTVLPTLNPVPVIVDSGTTLSLLPRELVEALAAQFPGAATDGKGGYTVPCAYQRQPGTVSFSLATSYNGGNGGGGPALTINVPYAEFVWNAGNDNCYLGAWYDTDAGVYILGDTFLRGAYVVFDQDSDALYMANYVACGDGDTSSGDGGLVAVPAGRDAATRIPGSCVPAGGAGEGGAGGGNNDGPSSSVVLPGGPVSSPGLGGDVDATINPAGPVSVSSSTVSTPAISTTSAASTSAVAAGISSPSPSSTRATTTAPGTTPAASPTSTAPTSLGLAPSTSSAPSGGPGLDPNAVPAGGSGSSSGSVGAATMTTTTTTSPQATMTATATEAAGIETTGAMSETITTTITSLIVYTVTACAPNRPSCVPGQVATQTSLYVTTICPEEETIRATTPTPVPSPNPSAATTITTAPTVGAAGAGAGAGAAPGDGDDGGAVVVKVTEQCHTSTYAVTSCPPGAPSCTIGMTTTDTFTEYRTVMVTVTATETAVAAEEAVTTAAEAEVTSPGIDGDANVGDSPSTALSPAAEVGPFSNSSSNSNSDDLVVDGASSSSSEAVVVAAATGCAGASCGVWTQGSVPTTFVVAGAERSLGSVKGWWLAVGIGAFLVLVLGGS